MRSTDSSDVDRDAVTRSRSRGTPGRSAASRLATVHGVMRDAKGRHGNAGRPRKGKAGVSRRRRPTELPGSQPGLRIGRGGNIRGSLPETRVRSAPPDRRAGESGSTQLSSFVNRSSGKCVCEHAPALSVNVDPVLAAEKDALSSPVRILSAAVSQVSAPASPVAGSHSPVTRSAAQPVAPLRLPTQDLHVQGGNVGESNSSADRHDGVRFADGEPARG
jgi:hypothetical protein